MSYGRKCSECYFWHAYGSGAGPTGQCRRHAPVVLRINADGESENPFPETHEDDWCGDFLGKPFELGSTPEGETPQ